MEIEHEQNKQSSKKSINKVKNNPLFDLLNSEIPYTIEYA